ncbi:uncharacterized protein [Aegilops tauschii subsp. strangulata]|uniref:uncharacterized protein isoform X2 n=1 Tax=Aegilops tauschii subsp. strangulata TaxID=200361 RepID=UPI00098A17EA|nr:uncharacterized protein LOC109733235 isoform X2 [Aegilops tauschii subsp. strangulata]XP_045084899.1 uncharacterized protein LOC109733235 isoform X2 [Aegilops tauschii subsp. strangulata]XP_045084900.1 uncharacterized protein LOC109733235 isoform X2 [Aegilops tauschii subsp. strangulata]XP_045084901.1 uncharacterized protein LOC109733235 isoform X2 [Aegilops tauschii subsp. strangulata]
MFLWYQSPEQRGRQPTVGTSCIPTKMARKGKKLPKTNGRDSVEGQNANSAPAEQVTDSVEGQSANSTPAEQVTDSVEATVEGNVEDQGHEGGFVCNCGATKMGGASCNCGSYLLPKGGKLTKRQKALVTNKISEIGSASPLFVKVMTADLIKRKPELYFCKAYVLTCRLWHEEWHEQTIPLTLLLEDRTMNTWLLIGEYMAVKMWNSIYCWNLLVEEAEIKPGEICLFQLVERSGGRITMRVHVIRKSEMPQFSLEEPRTKEINVRKPRMKETREEPRTEETHLSPAGGYVGNPHAEPSGGSSSEPRGSDNDSRPKPIVKRRLLPSPCESPEKKMKMQLEATTSIELSPEAPAEETHPPQ